MAKRKRKVQLPCDRTGEPIHIGDVLQWYDGTRLQVSTYYGEDSKAIGCWTAEEFADNLKMSLIVWRKKCKSK